MALRILVNISHGGHLGEPLIDDAFPPHTGDHQRDNCGDYPTEVEELLVEVETHIEGGGEDDRRRGMRRCKSEERKKVEKP